MGNWWRWLAVSAVGVMVILSLTACMNPLTGPKTATLVLGEVHQIGGHGEILLSVVNMPDGGLASVAVQITGIQYDQTKISNVAIAGLNGFDVLAEQFVSGSGGFVVAHPCAGLPSGEFAKLTFDANASVSLLDFAFTKSDIDMGDDSNNVIVFQMTDDYNYYAN